MGYSFRHVNEEWVRTIKTWKYDGEYLLNSYENKRKMVTEFINYKR